MEEEYVSQDVLLDFLRKLSPKMVSSETLMILYILIDKATDVRINLNDFSEMYPSESDYELKVLQIFASRKATQISFLEIKNAIIPSDNNPPLMESQMWTEIAKFKNVKNLSINKYQFLLRDLMEMCKNMPNLNEIQVVIECDSEFPEDDPQFIQEFSNSFDKIKEFVFHAPGRAMKSLEAMSFSGKLTKFGIKHLPNLKWFATIGFYIDKSLACQEMDISCKLQYFRLNAIYLEEFASKFDKFPSVEALVVSWTELNDVVSQDSKINKKKLNLLKKFKKLNDLCLCNLTSPEYLTVLLDNLGQKLKFLDINYDTDHKMKIDLNQIQETCPLLSNLTINVADFEESQSMDSFRSLKKLQIIFDTNSSEKVCLSNLLSPPNLEVVHLEGFQVTRQELQEMTLKIKDKTILTKVKKLGLFLNWENSGEMKVALEKEGKRLVSAVLNMQQIDEENVTLEFF
ncbi:Hypothetical predicted protein [Cloeon dipterum]|uniref:Uncharacterized protein n=1 Tax=Cloeon dipterum TaxID=197152 RepID=A0A8S1D0P9_9INSE|nr:Hypothetical predicted protein [Cloeon dipterum]